MVVVVVFNQSVAAVNYYYYYYYSANTGPTGLSCMGRWIHNTSPEYLSNECDK